MALQKANKTLSEQLAKLPAIEMKDSPQSDENPFKKSDAEESDAEESKPKLDRFFEGSMKKMQALHDQMHDEINETMNSIKNRFEKRIGRLDKSSPDYNSEKTKLDDNRDRLLRERELKIRKAWQQKMDVLMESTLEVV